MHACMYVCVYVCVYVYVDASAQIIIISTSYLELLKNKIK